MAGGGLARNSPRDRRASVREMTLRHYFTLHGIGSPFITGDDYQPEDIAIFLWVLSPEYVPCQHAKKDFFKKAIKVKLVESITQISDFMEMTFADAEAGGSDESPSRYASFLAFQIDLLAHEYGWTIDYILELPLRQIFQLNSAIGYRYAQQNGQKYHKMRAVDMMHAEEFFKRAKEKKRESKSKLDKPPPCYGIRRPCKSKTRVRY